MTFEDLQDSIPVFYCMSCGREVYRGSTIYELKEKGDVCSECFSEYVQNLLKTNADFVADEMGINYTNL